MDQDSQIVSPEDKGTGCFLLGLFPIILIGSAFVAGTLEKHGNRIVGWLWIPFSILVMFAFGIIDYRVSNKIPWRRISYAKLVRPLFRYIMKQILVLLILAVIAWLLAHLNPFYGVRGSDLH